MAEEDQCDTLAFARFLPPLAARVLSLTLAVPATRQAWLASFTAAFGGVQLVDSAFLPPHDLVLQLASAPAALGLLPGDVPPPLLLPAERQGGAVIGVALAPSRWNRRNGTSPEGVVPILRQAFPGFRLVALDSAAALRLGSDPVGIDPATLAGLDLVVTTDGPAAHAAGVVGAPLWLLLDHESHWMWGREGHFSRWYPSARLFRAEGESWQGIANALASEAKAFLTSGLSDIAALNRVATAAESVEGPAAARAALPLAARLVALDRGNPQVWARLAGLLFRLGETNDADRILDAGLSMSRRHAPLLLLASRRDLERGQPASALRHADQALAIEPASVDALISRAAAFAALGERARAEFALRQAVHASPRQADLLVAWGEALRGLGDTRGASRAFERAALIEDGADARLGLGRLAAATGEPGLALHFLGSAVDRDNGHVEAAIEFAHALSVANRTGEAIKVLRRLVDRHPSPAARAFLGELLLDSGDFAAGLAEFEWRRGEARTLPSLADLAGRNVVLAAEGGAGVLMRFLRFVPALKVAGAATVRVAGADELATLLAHMDGLDPSDKPGENDLVLPIMSLPALFGVTIENLPSPRRYLHPDPAAVTNSARAFAHLEGFRIGLALEGPISSLDTTKLTALSGMAFVALDPAAAALVPNAWPLAVDPGYLDKVAAALPNLDAVVASADSPIAPLAGAIGRPAFVIGPDRDDWLWLERNGRTPWFQSMRLFSRRSGEDEADRISRLVAALVAFAAGDRAVPFQTEFASRDGASMKEDGLASSKGAILARAGLAALASRDDHRAALLLGDAVAAGAAEPELREKLAAAYLRIGERDRAGSLLAALVTESPTAERLVELSETARLAGRLEEALAHAERAVELRPDLARAHRAIGKALVALGRASEALVSYGRAVTLAPTDPELLMDEGEALLMAGDYRQGFGRAEVRWQAPELLPRRFSAPRWTGEDIQGRTLLVHGERDLGLDIAFARFLPQLLARGPRLLLEVRPALTDLFRRLDIGGNVTVVEQGRRLPSHDLEVPLRSLPHVLGIERNGLPMPARFLPDPLRVDAWQRFFGREGRASVGLYWRNAADAALLGSLAGLDDIRLFALDRRAGRASLGVLPRGINVEPLGDRLGGFVETSAAMTALDLVVGPVSTTAHLAATLGRPTVVLDPSPTDWLWTGERSTPWYPQACVWRPREDLGDLLRRLLSERPAS